MAAAIHPPHPFPALPTFRPRLVRPVAAPRPAAVVRRPTAATYRRRRLVALVLALGLLAGLATVSVRAVAALTSAADATAPTAAAAPAFVPAAAHAYVVQPGDTLWTIARRLQPEGDVRPLVDRLAQRHGGAALRAGERLDLSGLDATGS